ncbi:hypothetical protein [Azospirillum sp. Sh1]|uniref:hypothetical protein n=1 Tax=Azospirillum sp. Sh1 TaxID=2607285 RepID=UPI0011EE584D|nr:hypothetical protein [Azospirillum sp. Sh1]KAA0573481.1 hypothetical protein FZ029_21125 [Azospirillum sp. Sh1]
MDVIADRVRQWFVQMRAAGAVEIQHYGRNGTAGGGALGGRADSGRRLGGGLVMTINGDAAMAC